MLATTIGTLLGAGFGAVYGSITYMVAYHEYWEGILILDPFDGKFYHCSKPSMLRVVGWTCAGATVGFGVSKYLRSRFHLPQKSIDFNVNNY